MVCRAQVRTGLGKSDRPGSQGGFEKRGQLRLWRSGARTQFRARQPHARFDGRGLETERYGVTAPAPDPTNLQRDHGTVARDSPDGHRQVIWEWLWRSRCEWIEWRKVMADCVFQTAPAVMIWFQTAKRLVISVVHVG